MAVTGGMESCGQARNVDAALYSGLSSAVSLVAQSRTISVAPRS
jgi:hypothetical protein